MSAVVFFLLTFVLIVPDVRESPITHAQILSLCDEIVEAQDREIAEMKSSLAGR